MVEMGSPSDQHPAYIGDVKGRKLEASSRQRATSEQKSRKGHKGSSEEVFALHKGNVKYHDRHILRDISWKLAQGDRVVLTGANGKP